jgi:hypothetical protein
LAGISEGESVRRISIVLTVVFLSTSLFGQEPKLSVNETISYINKQLEANGVERKSCDAGSYQGTDKTGVVSLSSDHKVIILTAHDCYVTITDRVLVSSIKGISSHVLDSHSSVDLWCKDGECMHRLYVARGYSNPSSYTSWSVEFPENDELGKRLTRAFQHLVALLHAEAPSQLNPGDPFASPTD